MSTPANIVIKDEFRNGNVAIIYVHCDGYPSDLGVKISKFLDNTIIVNGIVKMKDNIISFNGMGDMAANMVKTFKKGNGGIYLESDVPEVDYIYTISWANVNKEYKISVCDDTNEPIFYGNLVGFKIWVEPIKLTIVPFI